MSTDFEPTTKQIAVLSFSGKRLLVDGPPGTGKTTIAALKIGQVAEGLEEHRQVLFLTFTNNATDRIGEALKEHLRLHVRKKICVINYHSLFYRMISSWGPWIGLPREIKLMSNAEHRELYEDAVDRLNSRVVMVRKQRRGVPTWFSKALAIDAGYLGRLTDSQKEIVTVSSNVKRAAHERGRIHFDDFDYYALTILRSDRLASAYRRKYPVIFVDEFQDINDLQYQALQRLAEGGCWYCFGDSEQTVFTWAGASRSRLQDFEINELAQRITLDKNHRYAGCQGITAIAQNLRRMSTESHGRWKAIQVSSPDVDFRSCKARDHQFAYAAKMLPGLVQTHRTVACFVPTNEEVRQFSSKLSDQRLGHRVLLDDEDENLWEDALLTAIRPHATEYWEALARALDHALHVSRFRKGGDYLELRALIKDVNQSDSLLERLRAVEAVFGAIANGPEHEPFQKASQKLQRQARQISRDPQLSLAKLERTVQQRRVQESLRGRTRVAHGVTVMTLHKAKGKEFDAALLFSPERGRFLGGPPADADEQHTDLMTWHTAASRPKSKLVIFFNTSSVSPYLEPFMP